MRENQSVRGAGIKADGSYAVLADNIPSGFQDVVIERDFPQPLEDGDGRFVLPGVAAPHRPSGMDAVPVAR